MSERHGAARDGHAKRDGRPATGHTAAAAAAAAHAGADAVGASSAVQLTIAPGRSSDGSSASKVELRIAKKPKNA